MDQNSSEVINQLKLQIQDLKNQSSNQDKMIWPQSFKDEFMIFYKSSGQSLSQVCKSLDLPMTTVYNWIYKKRSFKKPKTKHLFKELQIKSPGLDSEINNKPKIRMSFRNKGVLFEVQLSLKDLTLILGL